MKIDFYTTNPFKENLEFRINDFINNKLSVHEQFIKNLIAYAYFEVKKPIYSSDVEDIHRYSQEELLDMYFYAELYIYENNINGQQIKSLLGLYWDYETSYFLDGEHSNAFNEYLSSILDLYDCTEKIDAIIEMRTPLEKNSHRLKDYFKDQDVKIEHLDIEAIFSCFTDIFSSIYSDMCFHALKQFDFQETEISNLLILESIKSLNYFLNPKLLSNEELTLLHQTCVRWFEQNISDIVYFLDLKNESILFEEVRTNFYAIFNLTSPLPLNTTSISAEKVQLKAQPSKDYPIHVFKNSEAFVFFDSCAQHITSTKMLSFLYRKMFEIDQLIFLRDTEFRNWFNQQNYPITLDYPTDTHQRVATKERQEWMAIIEHFYRLNK